MRQTRQKTWGGWTLAFSLLAIPSERPTIEMQGFRMVETQERAKVVEAWARQARIYRNQKLMVLTDLRSRIWSQTREAYDLIGKIGLIESDKHNMETIEGSEVLTPDGLRFETRSMRYDAAQRNITSGDAVEMKQGEAASTSYLELTGTGLVVDLASNKHEISKNVRAKQRVSKSGSFDIRSAQASLDPKANNATFVRGVTLKSPEMELKGERLMISFAAHDSSAKNAGPKHRPQRMLLDSPGRKPRSISAQFPKMTLTSLGLEVDFNDDGSVRQSHAIGDATAVTKDKVKLNATSLVSVNKDGKDVILLKDKVKIVTDTQTATCQEAQFFPDTGDIVLERVATVLRGNEVIEGELIRLSTKNSTVLVERASGIMNK